MKQGTNIKLESLSIKNDRKNSQGYVNIKSKTLEELKELIERQNKLLQNRSFSQKLPDKGKRLFVFKSELEAEYQKRQEEYETTCQLMSNLNLNSETVEELEWSQGKLKKCGKKIDSDDDDDASGDEEVVEETKTKINPLKLVATHSGTACGKKIKYVNTNRSVDVKELYADKICEKYGKSNNYKERFKPNQLKNNNKSLFVSSAEKVKERLGEKWEVTEATPPVPVYKDTIMISLPESLKLQKEQAEKLKEIEKKQAALKLLQNMSVKMGDKLPQNNLSEYRNTNNFFDGNGEDEENNSNDSDNENLEKSEWFPAES